MVRTQQVKQMLRGLDWEIQQSNARFLGIQDKTNIQEHILNHFKEWRQITHCEIQEQHKEEIRNVWKRMKYNYSQERIEILINIQMKMSHYFKLSHVFHNWVEKLKDCEWKQSIKLDIFGKELQEHSLKQQYILYTYQRIIKQNLILNLSGWKQSIKLDILGKKLQEHSLKKKKVALKCIVKPIRQQQNILYIYLRIIKQNLIQKYITQWRNCAFNYYMTIIHRVRFESVEKCSIYAYPSEELQNKYIDLEDIIERLDKSWEYPTGIMKRIFRKMIPCIQSEDESYYRLRIQQITQEISRLQSFPINDLLL